MGRPSHVPEPFHRRQVEAMAGYGILEHDIARVLGVDPKTLRKHYREEVDTGQIKANSKVAESLFRKATGDDRQSVTAAIFWLKTRAGWKEAAVHQVSGGLVQARIDGTSDVDVEQFAAEFSRRIEALANHQLPAPPGREPLPRKT